jgi:hypothetical protein
MIFGGEPDAIVMRTWWTLRLDKKNETMDTASDRSAGATQI